jgi:hypothetical protein
MNHGARWVLLTGKKNWSKILCLGTFKDIPGLWDLGDFFIVTLSEEPEASHPNSEEPTWSEGSTDHLSQLINLLDPRVTEFLLFNDTSLMGP